MQWLESRPSLSFLAVALLVIGSPSASAQWVRDGATICAATNMQWGPKSVSDGSGGAIVVWPDMRSGGVSDVFVQRVNAHGVVLWTVDGVALCNSVGASEEPAIVADGSGGATIAWQDQRNGLDYDIYAQGVTSSGSLKWNTEVAVCTALGDQQYPCLTADSTGSVIIAWQDDRSNNWNIYAQKVSALGANMWAANGAVVCNSTGDQTLPDMTSDGANGAIIAWEDQRGLTYDIYAQHVSAAGTMSWTANGRAVCSSTGNEYFPVVATDGASGAIVGWADTRSGWDIRAQRVSGFGMMIWTAGGVAVCTAAGTQDMPQIVADGAGGAILTWWDQRSDSGNVYAQKLDSLGVIQWTVDGAAICTKPGQQAEAVLTGDGTGGAILAWSDYRSGANPDIYGQRISSPGFVQWTVDGVPLVTDPQGQWSPSIAPGAPNIGLVPWCDWRNVADCDIYAQRAADPFPGNGYCFGDPMSGTPCPCNNDNDGTVPGSGCANGVFTSGAQLTGSGEARLTNDTLVLAATSMEPNNFGLYFQADNNLWPGVPWGDGLRCCGGNLKRLQVQKANHRGDSATTLVISIKAGNVFPGDTKYYQCWYRNPLNSPCGFDFNTTNGYEVTWLP